MRYEVDLGEVSEGYVGPRPGGKAVRVLLGNVAGLPKHDFYPSAIKTVCRRIAEQLKNIGFGDYDVIPHPADIDAEGKDTRFTNQTALRLLVRPMPKIVEAPVIETPVPAPAVAAKPREMLKAEPKDGMPYSVSQIIIEYAEEHPAHPELRSTMEEVAVALAETDKGYIAAPAGYDPIVVRLVDIPLLSKPVLYGSAIQAISRGIVAHYSGRGYIGINVAPHPEDIDQTAKDIRPEGITALRILVRIGRVTEVRTIAAGERVDTEERINNPLHKRLIARSPVQPDQGGETGGEQGKDLLRKDQLDRYINWLNRHPGRRVDLAVSPAQTPGGVALDYMVTENKPWTVYAQISNTGTSQTDEWRERFGFIHNQVTNNDDIFSIDYVTAGFQDAHAVVASYEAPLFNLERVRWRTFGSYSNFQASDVGFANEQFSGSEWAVGADLIFNVYQRDQLFVDLVTGAKFQDDFVNNVTLSAGPTSDVRGTTEFVVPHVGFQAEQYTETTSLFALVDFEASPVISGENTALVAGQNQLSYLGRDQVTNKDTTRVKFDSMFSFYLEPLIYGDSWQDPSQPSKATLAHEIAFMVRGQWSPDRNVPQFERTVGGLYSVRGYDESITAGDTVVIATAEYRFHLPRVFTPEPDPRQIFGQPFRVAPQHVYGRPDWDLILRGFADYAHTWNNNRATFESDHDLASVGVGAELLIKRNFNIRVDWGYVLETLQAKEQAGDSRFHIVATFLY
jgi:hemolysin activation/secretion protein